MDTSGAGDVFHGAYVYSQLAKPYASWDEHFHFARAAAGYKVQHLGNEAGLPTLADIRRYGPNMATRDPNEFFTVAQKPAPLLQLSSNPKTLPWGER